MTNYKELARESYLKFIRDYCQSNDIPLEFVEETLNIYSDFRKTVTPRREVNTGVIAISIMVACLNHDILKDAYEIGEKLGVSRYTMDRAQYLIGTTMTDEQAKDILEKQYRLMLIQ